MTASEYTRTVPGFANSTTRIVPGHGTRAAFQIENMLVAKDRDQVLTDAEVTKLTDMVKDLVALSESITQRLADKKAADKAARPAKPGDDATVADIRAYLTEQGVEIPKGTRKKADLLALV